MRHDPFQAPPDDFALVRFLEGPVRFKKLVKGIGKGLKGAFKIVTAPARGIGHALATSGIPLVKNVGGAIEHTGNAFAGKGAFLRQLGQAGQSAAPVAGLIPGVGPLIGAAIGAGGRFLDKGMKTKFVDALGYGLQGAASGYANQKLLGGRGVLGVPHALGFGGSQGVGSTALSGQSVGNAGLNAIGNAEAAYPGAGGGGVLSKIGHAAGQVLGGGGGNRGGGTNWMDLAGLGLNAIGGAVSGDPGAKQHVLDRQFQERQWAAQQGRQLEANPLRDRLLYQMTARAGMTQPTLGVNFGQNGQYQGLTGTQDQFQGQVNDMNAAYKPGMGGTNLPFQQGILHQMGYDWTPGGPSGSTGGGFGGGFGGGGGTGGQPWMKRRF